jgi:CheY-like chemotaxis protein
MQLLIVHRDPEMAESLVQLVKDYTLHDCDLAGSSEAALDWARRHRQCDLLLTQTQAEEFDGLALGSALSEIFSILQVLFFPSYAASEQCLEVAVTKVFPEPIDGDALLEAIARAEKAPANVPDLFHIVDILQMCCLSRRNGAIQVVKESKSGLVFLRNGKIAHAETTANRGRDALFEMFDWEYLEFAYERSVRPPLETIDQPWPEILIEAVTRHKEDKALRRRRSSVH